MSPRQQSTPATAKTAPPVLQALTAHLADVLVRRAQASWLARAATVTASTLTEEAEHVRALLRLHGHPIPDDDAGVDIEPTPEVLQLVMARGRSALRVEASSVPTSPTDEGAFAGTNGGGVVARADETPREPRIVHRSRSPWREEARRLLHREAQPLHYSVIGEHLASLGLEFGGRNPHATLLSYLSRDDDFTSVGRGYWFLATVKQTTASPPPVRTARGRNRVRAVSRLKGGH